MALIDVHSHILCQRYVELLAEHGQGKYHIAQDTEGRTIVMRHGARFLTLMPQMFDPVVRLSEMAALGVGTQLISYTGPNCYWAAENAIPAVVRVMNDHIAEVCAKSPGRYHGLASIPLQNVGMALEEMARAIDELGMVGLILLANVNEVPLDDPRFEPIWDELNGRRLPVLLHPTVPPGGAAMGLDDYGLAASVGFMLDTTLAVSRMIFAGVFERYPNWPLIVCHAGATLPYIASRLDRCYHTIPDARARISRPPSEYLANFYYDTVCYDAKALALACDLAGPGHLLFGTDYPHNVSDVKGCADRIGALPVTDDEKELIRSGNARRLFRLDET